MQEDMFCALYVCSIQDEQAALMVSPRSKSRYPYLPRQRLLMRPLQLPQLEEGGDSRFAENVLVAVDSLHARVSRHCMPVKTAANVALRTGVFDLNYTQNVTITLIQI